jgi:transcriptional regulator with XRE-family HTH domain
VAFFFELAGFQQERRKEMQSLDARIVAERLREVVADEPKAFAYDIGVSLSAVYNYLNGRIPSTEVLFRIARYTGRSMEWFLEGADSEQGLGSSTDVVEAAGVFARGPD